MFKALAPQVEESSETNGSWRTGTVLGGEGRKAEKTGAGQVWEVEEDQALLPEQNCAGQLWWVWQNI